MWRLISANSDTQVASRACRSLQWGKTPGELVPRSGDYEQLIDMLRGAAAENSSSRASVVGAPARGFHVNIGLGAG